MVYVAPYCKKNVSRFWNQNIGTFPHIFIRFTLLDYDSKFFADL